MNEEENRFTLEKVDIPFVDIVRLLVKWSLASIPALLILTIVIGILCLIGFLLYSFFLSSSVTFFWKILMLIPIFILFVVLIYMAFPEK
tara:strand:+ start:516 stop:782 length:267 start_codon:yes stop_codon:yes gene_type:complete